MRLASLLFLFLVLAGCGRDTTAPESASIPLTASVASVDVHPRSASIVWELNPIVPGEFLIQRQLEGAPWKGLAFLPADPHGRLVLEDVSVQPGARYLYRVRVHDGPVPEFAGVLAIEVPLP